MAVKKSSDETKKGKDKKTTVKNTTTKKTTTKKSTAKKDTEKKVSSRNKNKNKNKVLQTKAKEKETIKKNKAKEAASKLDKELANLEVSIEDINKSTKELKETREKIESETENIRNDVSVVSSRKKDDDTFVSIDSDVKDVVNDDKFKVADYLDDNDDLTDYQYSNNVDNPKNKDDSEIVIPVEPSDMPEKYATCDVYDSRLQQEEVVSINAKTHVSFETRVAVLLFLVVANFFVAGWFIVKSIVPSKEVVKYDEKSFAKHSICIKEAQFDNYYTSKCFDDKQEFDSSKVDNISSTLGYRRYFDKKYNGNIEYYVNATIRVYDPVTKKELTSIEDTLISRTKEKFDDRGVDFNLDLSIPYKQYYNYVNKISNIKGNAVLYVDYFIDDGQEVEKVVSIEAPLYGDKVKIKSSGIYNEGKKLIYINDDENKEINTSYSVVGLIFILFGLFSIIKLANLVCKVVDADSSYHKALNKILKDYDDIIVTARDEYVPDNSKRIVKVDTFKELIDARSSVRKPIIYVKINNVKSEFYVEDTEIIYKYTLKEADFDNREHKK